MGGIGADGLVPFDGVLPAIFPADEEEARAHRAQAARLDIDPEQPHSLPRTGTPESDEFEGRQQERLDPEHDPDSADGRRADGARDD